MTKRKLLALLLTLALAGAGVLAYRQLSRPDEPIISYRVNPERHPIRLYWRNEGGQPLRSIGKLRSWLAGRGEQLVFATNGGMFGAGNRPLGLFIEDQKTITPLDTAAGTGNFYLKPNGVFYLTAANKAGICRTPDFRARGVKYATQSGPLLLFDGQLHPALRRGSPNLNIRNGVGILPGGDVVFAMSKREINFYDFADYFRRLGCRQALYLDGFVSRTYLPAEN